MAPGQSECEACHQPVHRLFTTSQRLVELDLERHPAGTVLIIRDGLWIRALALTGDELPDPEGRAHRLHSCPQDAPAIRLKCASPSCRRPDVGLLDAYHPECHPEVTDVLLARRRAIIRAQFRSRRRRR